MRLSTKHAISTPNIQICTRDCLQNLMLLCIIGLIIPSTHQNARETRIYNICNIVPVLGTRYSVVRIYQSSHWRIHKRLLL